MYLNGRFLFFLIVINLYICCTRCNDYEEYEYNPNYSDKTTDLIRNTKPIESTTLVSIADPIDRQFDFSTDSKLDDNLGVTPHNFPRKSKINSSERYFNEREDDFLNYLYLNHNSDLTSRSKSDFVYNKLMNDYRIQNGNQRNLIRLPFMPMPPVPFSYPIFPNVYPQQQTSPKPQLQSTSPQTQSTQSASNQMFQTNPVQTGILPYPPVYPGYMPNTMHNLMHNNMQQWNNMQLQNAISNMISRNSFLGFIDPLIIIAIIAVPVIIMLGFSSVIMPFIPIIIYILNIFFPISSAAGRRRKKRSLQLIKSDFFQKLDHNETSQSDYFWLKLQKSLCKF